jgi:DNA-directed RNA polymerase specialized sigma24 family protein
MSEQRAEDIDDTALMAEVARGDTVAFERLIERHQALVIGTVGRMLGNNSEVEDVAQQVFIRVWKGAPRYRPTAKFTTWLLTITRNLVFNEARRRKRHPGDTLDVHEGEEALALTDPARRVPDKNYSRPSCKGPLKWQFAPCPRSSEWRWSCDVTKIRVMRKSAKYSDLRWQR